MLLVQKYNSLAEIETEFKETLEALIATEIPYLTFLEKAEKEKPAEHVFYYHLFFGQTSNMPVGFAMMELVAVPEKEFVSFMERMVGKVKKKANAKWLRFCGPSKQKTFFFFEQKHLKAGMIELSKIVSEMKSRDDVVVVEEWVNALTLSLLPPNDKKLFSFKSSTIAPMKKSFSSYEDYFRSLTDPQSVKQAWKTLMKDQIFDLQDNVELEKIPSHHKLKNYLNQNLIGQVISDENGPLASLVYIESKNANLHVDILRYRDHEKLTDTVLAQAALIRFFEKTEFQFLNFLEDLILNHEELRNQGFSPMSLEQNLEAKTDHVREILKQDDLRRYS